MNKTEKYHQIISQYLIEFADKFKDDDEFSTQAIIDKKHHHYQLLVYGWRNRKYVFSPQFHFSIENDEVWVHENITDIEVGIELNRRGIPNEDIVAAFVPEKARIGSGYGTGKLKVEV